MYEFQPIRPMSPIQLEKEIQFWPWRWPLSSSSMYEQDWVCQWPFNHFCFILTVTGTYIEHLLCARYAVSLFADSSSNPTSKMLYDFYKWENSERKSNFLRLTEVVSRWRQDLNPGVLDSKICIPPLTPPLHFSRTVLLGLLYRVSWLIHIVNPLWWLRQLKTPDHYFFSTFLLFCYKQMPIRSGPLINQDHISGDKNLYTLNQLDATHFPWWVGNS